MTGILAHLTLRLSKQRELAATEGLAFLLSSSRLCAEAFREYAGRFGCELPELLAYASEVVSEDGARPDIVGYDHDYKKRLIIEGKFDAGLTANQPVAYLNDLEKGEASLLLFVVPEARRVRLWGEVGARAAIEVDPLKSTFQRVSTGSVLAMASWNELLGFLAAAAQGARDPIAEDISQLAQLCNQMEGELFLPFSADELTSVSMSRRHRDLCDLTDAIAYRLVAVLGADFSGLRATPVKGGYIRYINLRPDPSDLQGAVSFQHDLWLSTEAGPLWFKPTNKSVERLRPVMERVALRHNLTITNEGSMPTISLPVAAGREIEEIAEGAANVVVELVREAEAGVDRPASNANTAPLP